jgi:hypothetical protein
MIPKSGNRFSEKHALGLDPRDHAQNKKLDRANRREQSRRRQIVVRPR